MRGDWLKIWIALQSRSKPRSTALGRPPAGDTCAPISVSGSYEGSLRTIAHGRLAHRRGAYGPVQLAFGQTSRGDLRPAHRGHRPRALHARERRADPRRVALAGARLGRGAHLSERRAPRHREALQALLESGHAYRSDATSEDVAAYNACMAPSVASGARSCPRRRREARYACTCRPGARPSCTTRSGATPCSNTSISTTP